MSAHTAPPDDLSQLAKFPLWQAILFNVLSAGFWGTYWVYRVRREQCRYLGRESDAVLQAVGSLVPVWNCFVVRNLWREADEMIGRAGTKRIGYRDFTALFIAFYGGGIILPPVWFGIPVLFVIVQMRLNDGLDALSGGTAPTMRFTFWSLIWILIPFLLFAALLLFIYAIATMAGV